MNRPDGECKHFNGIQNELCRAGINMRSLTGPPAFGWTKRMPCFKSNQSSVSCSLFEEYTEEELAEQEKEWEEAFQRIVLVQPLIQELKQAYRGQNWADTRPCPVCNGVLHLAISASNGHVHGRCETADCLCWME